MKAKVEIFYKDSVFDPQGSTLCQSLQRLGFQKVENARIGKVIQLDVEHSSPADAERDVREMCEKLLANPVIESYRIEINQ